MKLRAECIRKKERVRVRGGGGASSKQTYSPDKIYQGFGLFAIKKRKKKERSFYSSQSPTAGQSAFSLGLFDHFL